ncbi:TetR/AcrR family transcriptional regulator [Agromyces intestinalis]|uniref:TetR/AcrR family transcriptional regulator n=1 Tax=Agromyces intestinalis TaxID=2592652 RepID=A0A5C1YFT0_9MICO|nr:TetR/AcrR family transcriptional regulator [Agromyces intestinalis]QEO14375.1 TetR/AcrR family transcriptional regulator [Agromyces intestinalis]
MKPGPRRSVSQSDLVAAAFELLEQKGFAAVSVRGVAAALGLTPTAMYTYFPSKQALLVAMVEELLSGVAGQSSGADASPEAARDFLVVTAVALRARLREHPGAIALVTSGPLDGARALGLAERLGEAFLTSGAGDVDTAARAAHALLALVLGQVALETAWGEASEIEPAALWSDAPPHPITDAGAALGVREGAEGEFRLAIERLVDAWR